MATASSIRTRYRFGPFALDLRSGDLTKNGRPIRLQEKPRSVLIALAERPGQLITRAELHERLWSGDTFVDFEDGLNAAMSKLREALGDDIQSPRFVETVRGRGYRFLAKVEVAGVPGDLAPAPAEEAENLSAVTDQPAARPATLVKSGDAGKRHWKLLAAVLLASLAGASAVMLTLRWRAAHAVRVSIAVLPFANMTGNASQDYICNGITEELIARLAHLAPDRLRVIAPTSARMYAHSNLPAQQIAHELNVQYLIEGDLQEQGANIRVAVQLVRAGDESRLWANVYEGDLSSQFEFESSVADAVAHALSLRVPAILRPEYKPAKYEAHDAYLQGLYFLSQRSKEGFEQAIDSFGDAVAIDPKYAAAYAKLAATYNLMGQYGWMSQENACSQAWGAAKQAISLDPAQAEAHAALGFSLWFYRWDLPAAENEFRKAIALEPDNVDAHHWYAQMLMTAGRFPEAEQQMRSALDVDPRSPILRTNLGWLYYYEGRFPRAVEQLQSVLKENPGFLGAHYKLWCIYSTMGDKARAWQELQWVVQSTDDVAFEKEIMNAYRRGGYPGALRALDGQGDSEIYASMVDAARCMIFAGDSDSALRDLELAYQQRDGWLNYAAFDPAFASLRRDARFQQIMMSIRQSPSQ